MRAKPSEGLLAALAEVVGAIDGTVTGISISTPYICDCCQSEDEEAFPYHVRDKGGRLWADLCNDCFEILGCSYEEEDEDEDQQEEEDYDGTRTNEF